MKKLIQKLNKKGDIDIDMLIKAFIAITVLAVSIAGVVLLKGKGGDILGSLKGFFKFGG